MAKAFAQENIWIIGASSGIGAALAAELAEGGARLALSARRAEELNELNQRLGGFHIVAPLDVADADAITRTLGELRAQMGVIHRIIFLAAIYKAPHQEPRNMQFAKQLVEVNLLGAIYTSYAAIAVFDEQKKGQLVLCGSVAGYTGLPGGQPYSATKAAIINFAESLKAEVEDYIDIKVINPGFVRTRITDKNKFPMPMRIEPEAAAIHIAHGLQANAFEIHFPKAFTLAVKFLRLLPYSVLFRITRKMRGRV